MASGYEYVLLGRMYRSDEKGAYIFNDKEYMGAYNNKPKLKKNI